MNTFTVDEYMYSKITLCVHIFHYVWEQRDNGKCEDDDFVPGWIHSKMTTFCQCIRNLFIMATMNISTVDEYLQKIAHISHYVWEQRDNRKCEDDDYILGWIHFKMTVKKTERQWKRMID